MPKGIYKNPEERSKKISQTLTGRKKSPLTAEWKEKIRQKMIGRKHTWGDKISQALKRKPKSEEHRKKLSEVKKGQIPWNKGKKHPEEIKRKISKNRIGKCLRENNPNWQGGKSFEIYPEQFWRTKKAIRERDNYTCQLCGKYPSFDVHHIDYNKENNEPENLITLCKNCHTKTNFNRDYWQNYFQNKNLC